MAGQDHAERKTRGTVFYDSALPRQDPNTSPVHLSPAYRVRVIYGLTAAAFFCKRLAEIRRVVAHANRHNAWPGLRFDESPCHRLFGRRGDQRTEYGPVEDL
jgi:hypothetical protein